MDNPLVSIMEFANVAEAHIARAKLESEGIEAFLEGEQTVALYGMALMPISLKVGKADQDKAIKILKRAQFHVVKNEP